MELIDLSHPMEHGQQTFPMDPKLSIISHGNTTTLKYNITQIVMSSHQGTHLDAMYHFLDDGKTLDQMPLDWFYGKTSGGFDVFHIIVVGREDTGELEAQVRGSHHAWDIRLISAEALLKLVQIKENADGFDTGRKIRSLLRPMEYTRLDAMADVMFTATKEVEAAADANMTSEDGGDPDIEETTKAPEKGKWQFTDSSLIQRKRNAILAALALREGTNLVRRTRAVYWNTDRTIRVVCTISKSPSGKFMKDSNTG